MRYKEKYKQEFKQNYCPKHNSINTIVSILIHFAPLIAYFTKLIGFKTIALK